jgi:hypothetical protein
MRLEADVERISREMERLRLRIQDLRCAMSTPIDSRSDWTSHDRINFLSNLSKI